MFPCDEPGQPGQIDLSVKWLRRGRGGGGAESEVEQERQVIVSLGGRGGSVCDLTEQEGKEKRTEKRPLLAPR